MDITHLIIIGLVTVMCLLYHVYSYHRSDRKYEDCEKKCDDGKDEPCRTRTSDTAMDCDQYYKCIDDCKFH